MTLGPKLSVLKVIVTQRFLFVPRQPGTLPRPPASCRSCHILRGPTSFLLVMEELLGWDVSHGQLV